MSDIDGAEQIALGIMTLWFTDVPLCEEYADLRCCRLKTAIYPSSVLAICAVTKNDFAKRQAEEGAIPEFMRFNIVESEVRNVI